MFRKNNQEIIIKQQNKLFKNIVFILLTPIVILSVLLIYISIDNIEYQLQQSNEYKLNQINRKINNVVEEALGYYTGVGNQAIILNALNTPLDYSQYSLWKEVQEMLVNEKIDNYTKEAYLINWENNWNISKYGLKDNETGYFERYKNNGELERIDIIPRQDANGILCSILIELPIYQQEVKGSIVINLDQKAMQQEIEEILMGEILIIKDNRDEIIYSTEKEYEESKYYSTEYYDESMGWTYRLLYSKTVFLESIRELLMYYSLIIAVMISIGLFYSRYNVRLVYNPIRQILKKVTQKESITTAQIDHIQYIYNRVDKMVNVNNSLEYELDLQNDNIKEFILYDLIKGELDSSVFEEYKYLFESLDDKFRLIYIELVCENEQSKKDEIFDELKRGYKEYNFVHSILKIGQVLVLLAQDEINLYNELITRITDQQPYRVNISVSSPTNDLLKLNVLYQECMEVNKQQKLEKRFCAIDYYKYQEKNKLDLEVNYPTYVEYQLIEAIFETDIEKSQSQIKKFIEYIDQATSNLSTKQYFYMKLVINIIEESRKQGIEMPVTLLNKIYRGLCTKDIYTVISQVLVQPIIKELEKNSSNDKKKIIVHINQIIERENYDVSLKVCGEILGYHPGYISKILKEEGHKNFGEYILEKRLLKAKELLITTDMSIQDIAYKLNYSNSQNFIRYFKKEEKITPGTYRKQKNKINL